MTVEKAIALLLVNLVQVEAMRGTNEKRLARGESPAYDEQSFSDIISDALETEREIE